MAEPSYLPRTYGMTLPGPVATGAPAVMPAPAISPLMQIYQALSNLSFPSWDPSRPVPTGTPPTQYGVNPAAADLSLNGPLPTKYEGNLWTDSGLQMPGLSDFIPSTERLGVGAASTLPGVGAGVGGLYSIMKGLQMADKWYKGAGETPKAGSTTLPALPSWEEFQSEFGEPGPVEDPNVIVSSPFDINSMPAPPEFAAPPGMDMEKLQGAKRASILGALAQGAAQVDPTEAGSFARALASAGGSGAATAGDATARMEELAHRQALAEYEVSMKNTQNKYEYEGKKFEMMLPQMKATDDSIVVSEFKDGKYQVRVIRTDGILGNAEKLGKYIEAMGAPGPAAEAAEVSLIAQQHQGDPVGLNSTLLRMSIERTIENGAGEAVFGDKFKEIESGVRTDLNQIVGLNTKPAEYRREYSKRIGAKLLSDPEVVKNAAAWLPDAARFGSVSANILTKGGAFKNGE